MRVFNICKTLDILNEMLGSIYTNVCIYHQKKRDMIYSMPLLDFIFV